MIENLTEFRRPGTSLRGVEFTADYLWRLAQEGRLYVASDADQDDRVTGQTSFANTTPTFMLQVPAGITALPLFLNLSQTGTVAGGAIDAIIEIDSIERYASSGTSEKVFNTRKSRNMANKSLLYSGATAVAGYGLRLFAATMGQDVSPAEGAVPGPFWKPEIPYFLEGPAAWLVYTYAATTGPTWYWTAGWAEWSSREIGP